MRHQLESTRRPQVPLVEELDYLRSYAQLQEMRLGPRCPVQVALPTEAEVAGCTIAPLLLLALVENAFTHGTQRASGSFVRVHLALAGRRLTLTLRNALPPPGAAQVGTGTGLPNTRQRLVLLYPGRHYLHTAPTATEFQTDLTIDL
jgi:two-component system LytT family sensor kinase